MGMELIGRRLSADELRTVLDDPTMVDPLLFGDLDDDDAGMPDPELDLNKSWHGLHYLLTGTAWQIRDGAGAAILGGETASWLRRTSAAGRAWASQPGRHKNGNSGITSMLFRWPASPPSECP
ncbi:DUF1877 family protein [Micromonospora sp. NPDC049051]|uniref:DUF1877 family protein n=1 Tax=unclassified Micromonospora TaxID=2617518 RepID=UPI003720DE47